MSNKIKFLVMDVDGTLTDGRIYMGANGEVMKAFDIKDGFGIHDMLPAMNIVPVVITGRESKIVENRCKELNVSYLFQGISDKVSTLIQFLKEQRGHLSEVAYIGDDLNDKPCMQMIKDSGGLVGVPSNCCQELTPISDFICDSEGGSGAVREFIEWLRRYSMR